MLFSQELTTLLNAGLPLIDALESLAEKENAPQARKTLSELVRLLYEGKSFSQALGQLSAVFPPLYVALVQSSEKTGAVGEALGRYVSYRQRMDEVRQKIVSASIYPMLLLVVGGGVVLFLMGYVVPRFSLVFEGLGSNLPWLSQILMSSGMFLHAHQGEFFGALAGDRRRPRLPPAPTGLSSGPGPPDRKTAGGASTHLHVRTGAVLPFPGDPAARRHPPRHRHGHGPRPAHRGLPHCAWTRPANGCARGNRCRRRWNSITW